MKNVTITLDERTAAWARVYAARHNTSVSRMVGELLEQRMRENGEYEAAMRRFLAREPVPLKSAQAAYPLRADTHERPDLR